MPRPDLRQLIAAHNQNANDEDNNNDRSSDTTMDIWNERNSFESVQREKEQLYDHDDWVQHRSPERRMDETFDFMFPLLASGVLYFCYAAIVM